MAQVANVEALLAHGEWVRELVRHLVFDRDVADDVVQQTWLAALEHPPRTLESPRGWLSQVARRFAFQAHRKEARRRRSEPLAARPEASACDVERRIELHRALVDAIFGSGGVLHIVDTDPGSPSYLTTLISSPVPGTFRFAITTAAGFSAADEDAIVLITGLQVRRSRGSTSRLRPGSITTPTRPGSSTSISASPSRCRTPWKCLPTASSPSSRGRA